jgi:hypothetical protein
VVWQDGREILMYPENLVPASPQRATKQPPKTEPPAAIPPVTLPKSATVKDSGVRQNYPSGMRRDTQEGKPRLDLLLTEGLPFEQQTMVREAQLMTDGMAKYGERNWELANSYEEVARFKSSAFRHLVKWLSGETDEPHDVMARFNIRAASDTMAKIELGKNLGDNNAASRTEDTQGAG